MDDFGSGGELEGGAQSRLGRLGRERSGGRGDLSLCLPEQSGGAPEGAPAPEGTHGPLRLHRRLPRQDPVSLASERDRRAVVLLLRPLPPQGQGRRSGPRRRRQDPGGSAIEAPSRAGEGGAGTRSWLEAIASANPLLERFMKFRCDSVTGLVAELAGEARRLGRTVSLDLFSPSLAPLVGQDYRGLSRHCSWAKPMTYRSALGPAGLRLEIPALFEGVERLFGLDERRALDWCARHIPAFDRDLLERTRRAPCRCPSSRRKSGRRCARCIRFRLPSAWSSSASPASSTSSRRMSGRWSAPAARPTPPGSSSHGI